MRSSAREIKQSRRAVELPGWIRNRPTRHRRLSATYVAALAQIGKDASELEPSISNFYKKPMKTSDTSEALSASELISKRITELGDWRGATLSRIRQLIKEADPDVVEEWKWRGTPVWSHDGIICTGEAYKTIVKLTFAKGASLSDPAGLFNSSLDGNVRRAIDIREGEDVDEPTFKALVCRAVARNSSNKPQRSSKAKS